MALLNINKLTDGLPTGWTAFLRDWDRTLRAGNYPETTRYNYLNSRELHQMGEKPQVARSGKGPTRTPYSYGLAA